MAERLPRADEPLPLGVVAVRSGHEIVRQGELCPGFWEVEYGALLTSVVSDEGRVLALDVLGPGDPVGEPGGGPAERAARALRPCRLHEVTPERAAMLTAARARRVASLACELAWFGVADRVERRLQDLAARFGRPAAGGVLIPLTITQEDLASLAGTSRESANRAVRGLVVSGRLRVAARGRYVILSRLRTVPP